MSQACFKTFNVGYYSLVIMSYFSAGFLVIKRKDLKFIKRFFSNGFWGYIIIFFMALIIDYGRHFTHWDELMHWGKMTQEMLRLDKFYTDPASELLVHKYYPPGVPIFEMLWCRMSGGVVRSRTDYVAAFSDFFIYDSMADRKSKFCRKTDL